MDKIEMDTYLYRLKKSIQFAIDYGSKQPTIDKILANSQINTEQRKRMLERINQRFKEMNERNKDA